MKALQSKFQVAWPLSSFTAWWSAKATWLLIMVRSSDSQPLSLCLSLLVYALFGWFVYFYTASEHDIYAKFACNSATCHFIHLSQYIFRHVIMFFLLSSWLMPSSFLLIILMVLLCLLLFYFVSCCCCSVLMLFALDMLLAICYYGYYMCLLYY